MSLNSLAFVVMRWHSVLECFTNMVAIERLLLCLFLPTSCLLDSLFSSKPGGGRDNHETSISVVNKHWIAKFLIDLELGPVDKGSASIFHGPVASILNTFLEWFCTLSLGNPCLRDNCPHYFLQTKNRRPLTSSFWGLWCISLFCVCLD